MRIHISGHQFYFPQICACCAAPAQVSLVEHASQHVGKGRLQTTATRAWKIPYCRACVRHIRWFEGTLWILCVLVASAAIACGLLLLLTSELLLSLQLLVAVVLAAITISALLFHRARRLRVSGCTGVARSVHYQGWQGSHHVFHTRSWRFAYDFMSLNERKLINLTPHTVKWLKKSGIDQEKAPQAAERYLPDLHR